jgi:magnesium-transporting ATPase (P-type)
VRELLFASYFNNKENAVKNSIDAALFEFAKKNLKMGGLDKAYKLVDEIEFNSSNKYHVKLLEPVNIDIHHKLFGYAKKYQEINV